MKIKGLRIENLKGIKELSLSFEKEDGEINDLIVLVGANGTGKTTILEFIKERLEAPYETNFEKEIPLFFTEEEAKVFLKFKNKYGNEEIKSFIAGLKSYKRELDIFDYGKFIEEALIKIPKIIYLPTRVNFDSVYTKGNTLSREDKFVNIVNSETFKEIPSYIATRRNFLANTNDDLTMKAIKDKLAKELNEIFDILDLDVKFIGLSRDEKSMPIFTNSSGAEFDINDLSSGEKQLFLRTLSIKMLEPENSILLIDEPEISLHPKWQQRIIEVYKKIGKNNQIIIATHSPHILGSVEEENIILLTKEKDGNIKALTGEELHLTYGQPVNRILKDIMGLETTRSPIIYEKIQTLRKLVNENKHDTDEFKELYIKLENILGKEDEDLFLINMDIKLKQKVKPNV